MVNHDFGFNTEDIVNVRINDEVSYGQFKTRLLAESSITSVAGGSHIPGIGMIRDESIFKELDGNEPESWSYFNVDEDYMKVMGLELLAGSPFTAESTSWNEIIINEKAVENLGFNNVYDAVNEIVFSEDSSQLRIVGVMKDFHYMAVMAEIGPSFLVYDPEGVQIAHITIDPRDDKASATIENAYGEVSDGYKADMKLLADEIQFFYDLTFGDLMRIVFIVTILSIVISCMGLLGIATYTIETKLKEVSIRKIMGASDKQLIVQLSRGFVIMLFIAIIISLPLSWLINNLWLQQIAYRVDFNPGVVMVGVGTLVFFGLSTILSQTWKAGTIAPIEHLRNE